MKAGLTIALFLLSTAGLAHASITVAAKDSPGRERADFTCDGINDQVEIQQAIDALPASGGLIELFDGTFNFSDDVQITKSNVTIRGAGKSTILKHNPTRWVKLTADSDKGANTVTVQDASQFHVGQLIGITNEELSPTAKGSPEKYKEALAGTLPYYTTYLTQCDMHLIEAIQGSTLTLDRGLERAMSPAGNPRVAPAWVMIKAYAKENLELRDFSIDGNWDSIAKIYGGEEYSNHPGPQPARAKDYVCPFPQMVKKLHHGEEAISAIYMDSAHNSKFRNLHLHDIASVGLFLIESDRVLVQGNTIRNFGIKGYVNPFGDFTQIIGNLVENSLHEDGINVYHNGASSSVVSSNIVRNCPRVCISINQSRRAVVTGNNISGGGVGIAVVSQEATVTGNYVEHVGVGVMAQALPEYWGDPSADYPITLMGNTLQHCNTGFLVRRTNHVNIVGNSVAHTTGGGAVVSGGGNRFIISNNQFLHSSSDQQPAISLGGDDHFIFGNKISNFKKGVWLQSTAEGNVIERNQFIETPEPIVDEGKGNTKERNW